MKRLREFLNPVRPIRSPLQAMLQLAMGLSLGFAVVHLAGWRECTSFISGTVGAQNPMFTAVFGLFYLIFYFGATLGVPILLLGAGIYRVGQLFARR